MAASTSDTSSTFNRDPQSLRSVPRQPPRPCCRLRHRSSPVLPLLQHRPRTYQYQEVEGGRSEKTEKRHWSLERPGRCPQK
eukprot:4354959-Pyramimonas_sp.AAC.1